MKSTLLMLSLFGLIAAIGASAAPAAAGGGLVCSKAHIPTGNVYRKRQAILALAREGRNLQEADGGTLTPAHHAYLQAKLEAIRAGNY